jgi:hypothetical protein
MMCPCLGYVQMTAAAATRQQQMRRMWKMTAAAKTRCKVTEADVTRVENDSSNCDAIWRLCDDERYVNI